VALIVSNWALAIALFLEYLAAQNLLRDVQANWQDEYDSGSMAFAALPVMLWLVVTTVVALAALFGLIIRRVRSAPLGWVTLLAHLALLAGVVSGPAAPGSATSFWAHLAILTACAVTGVVAGAHLLPPESRRHSLSPLEVLNVGREATTEAR